MAESNFLTRLLEFPVRATTNDKVYFEQEYNQLAVLINSMHPNAFWALLERIHGEFERRQKQMDFYLVSLLGNGITVHQLPWGIPESAQPATKWLCGQQDMMVSKILSYKD